MKNICIKTNGIKLQVRDHEHAGDALLFLHFGGANLAMWQRALPYFEKDYRPVLIDLRGHGKSDKPETGNHMDEMARDVAGVLDALQIERAHIVGSSLGAEVGLALAANFPQRVLSLTCDGALADEYGPYGVWEGSKASYREYVTDILEKMRKKPEPVFPSVDAYVAAKREAFAEDGWWNEYFEALFRYDACQIGPGEYTNGWRKHAKVDYMRSYFDYRFEDYYPRVQCPVLMLADEGDEKNERMMKAIRGLCGLAPRGRVAIVPGWIHPYGWLLDPDRMCTTVLEFLAEIRA